MGIILTPELVKADTSGARAEQVARVRNLAEEEERLIGSINMLRKHENEALQDKIVVDKEVDDYRKGIEPRKAVLLTEVTDLENRKAEAMKPVNDKMREADERFEIVSKREENVLSRETTLTAREHDSDLRKIELEQRAADFIESEAQVTTRETKVQETEERVHADDLALDARKKQFEDDKIVKEAELAKREAQVEAGEKANVDRESTFEGKEFYYQERDREIKSRYAVLENSTNEFYKLRDNYHGTIREEQQ